MNNIMVVDDDPNIRELIRLILKKEGFEVLEASDGEDALEKIEDSKVDLIVLDIMMPNMDGWDLCKEIRRFRELPILMLTAKGETSQKVKGSEGIRTDVYAGGIPRQDVFKRPTDRRYMGVRLEIQSPLTSIRGFVSLLKNDNLSSDRRLHYIEVIESETARLSRLGENLFGEP